MKTAPRLKPHSGWFPAGEGFERALGRLSDGAFKVFAHVCPRAERASGRLEFRRAGSLITRRLAGSGSWQAYRQSQPEARSLGLECTQSAPDSYLPSANSDRPPAHCSNSPKPKCDP